MKKTIYTLAIIMAMVFTGMQNTQGQITIQVNWYTQCPDTCTAVEPCAYKVEYTLKNVCTHPEELICSGLQWVSCDAFYADFPCNYSCDDPSQEECYLLEGKVTKYCKGPLGEIAICMGSGDEYYTCTELMTLDPVPVTVDW